MGELNAVLQRVTTADKNRWIHTSQMMALLYNINAGKSNKSLTWEDFNPYEYERRKTAAPTELNAQNLATFGKMTKTLNHGKKNGSA